MKVAARSRSPDSGKGRVKEKKVNLRIAKGLRKKESSRQKSKDENRTRFGLMSPSLGFLSRSHESVATETRGLRIDTSR